jgi:carboxyl-terminal processing protease
MPRLKQIIMCVIFITTPITTRATFGESAGEIVDGIRKKVILEQKYEFGKECNFALKDKQAILLHCTENPDGIDSVLIYLTFDDIGSKTLFIYLLQDGEIIGGRSSIESSVGKTIGTVRAVKKGVAIAKYNVDGGQLDGSFIFTDDRQIAAEKFMDLIKNGFITTYGKWDEKIDFDSLRLTPDEQIEGFVRLWAEIKYSFANFDLVPELDWNRVLTEYLPRVRREQTLREFNRLLAECVSQLKDGHTNVSIRFIALFDFAQPALRVWPVDGRAVITEVGQSPDIIEAGLHRGEEIVLIDGRAVKDILEKDIYPYIFASTPQDRDIKAFYNLLLGPPDTEVVLRIRDLQGQERNVKLIRWLYWVSKIPTKQRNTVEYMDLSDGIAYIAINSFGSDEVVNEFDRIMERIGRLNGLIIDVRKNPGGNSSIGDAIISRLIEKPIPSTLWKTPQHVAAFKAWGRPRKWFTGESRKIEPRQGQNYLGPLVILIGPQTASAAEDFVVPLHAGKRATLVGEKTAGTTGQPLKFNFSYIIRGQVCTKRDTYPDGREFVGIGIIPDVEVHPTPADIASGRDVVLEKGIEVLHAKIK